VGARDIPPVVVTVSPADAAVFLRDLLDDYFAELSADRSKVTIAPIDDMKRGTVFYRVIQASRTVADRYPDATLFVITEDGMRWRLPPPAI
jgi:hypothetical protein